MTDFWLNFAITPALFKSKASYRAGSDQPSRTDGDAYDRDDYHTRWLDRDGDCMDTRNEVLAQESRVEPTISPDGCDVVDGQWYDPYIGKVFKDPSKLDIDHVVPLAEAHASGSSEWPAERRRRYANDLKHPAALIAVSASANRSKGADDPADWMPPNDEFHCGYIRRWTVPSDVPSSGTWTAAAADGGRCGSLPAFRGELQTEMRRIRVALARLTVDLDVRWRIALGAVTAAEHDHLGAGEFVRVSVVLPRAPLSDEPTVDVTAVPVNHRYKPVITVYRLNL